LGLVAAQTSVFLSAAVDDSVAMVQRRGDAHAGGLAAQHRSIGRFQAAHGGEEAVIEGDGISRSSAWPPGCADAAIQMQWALVVQAWPGTRRC
jgi:hypothetical protein